MSAKEESMEDKSPDTEQDKGKVSLKAKILFEEFQWRVFIFSGRDFRANGRSEKVSKLERKWT